MWNSPARSFPSRRPRFSEATCRFRTRSALSRPPASRPDSAWILCPPADHWRRAVAFVGRIDHQGGIWRFQIKEHRRRARTEYASGGFVINEIFKASINVGLERNAPIRFCGASNISADSQPHRLPFEVSVGLLSLRRDLPVGRGGDAEDVVV